MDKCHPLGMFDSIATLAVASNMRELYRLVLVDTPLAPYFSENLTHEVKNGCMHGKEEGTYKVYDAARSSINIQPFAITECLQLPHPPPSLCMFCALMQDLDEMNIEIMRNTLYKAYLDDFAEFCQSLGGATAEVMGDLLAFEVGTNVLP